MSELTNNVADDLDPAAVERAASQVLEAHRPVGWARDGRVLCAHHDPDADVRPAWLTPAEHAAHQAGRLAAAGLLVTPEHDAQVAARAWDEGWEVGREEAETWRRGDTPNPYRIERQEEGR